MHDKVLCSLLPPQFSLRSLSCQGKGHPHFGVCVNECINFHLSKISTIYAPNNILFCTRIFNILLPFAFCFLCDRVKLGCGMITLNREACGNNLKRSEDRGAEKTYDEIDGHADRSEICLARNTGLGERRQENMTKRSQDKNNVCDMQNFCQ